VSKADQGSVVVTGLGATTPLGGDAASTWSAMLAGTAGVRRLTDGWVDSLPVKIAAPAAVDPVAVVGRVQARRMDRCEQLALVAAREAWADAGSPTVDPWRLGVAVTSGIGGIGSTLGRLRHAARQGLGADLPVHRPDADAQRRRRLDQHRARRPGGRARPRERVRLRCRGDRVRHRHDPLRPGRHRRRRRR